MNIEDCEEQLVRLRNTYERLRSQMSDKWHRDLPFEELLFGRWERPGA